MNPLHSSLLPPTPRDAGRLRVATYNIHKGVRGLGPAKRLEIHNLVLGIEALQADVVCLQEVRRFHRGEARRFQRSQFGWPDSPQADFLAPQGFSAVYRTNAVTRGGEHGNALLTRWPVGEVGHEDVSDHRFEQRGLLHVPLDHAWGTVHAVVAHFGLSHGSRVRQVQRLGAFIERHVPHAEPLFVGGDFNDWGEKLDPLFHAIGLRRAVAPGMEVARTFPSLAPVFGLDRIYVRGLRCVATAVPRGSLWARMSDHLPLAADFIPA